MKMFNKLVLGSVLAFALFASFTSHADEPFYEGMVRKLGRGLANAGFGAVEIPKAIYDTNHEEGGIAAVTYGPIKGVFWFVARELVGVTEVATFLVPLPGCKEDPRDAGWGYGPIMRPEWIITPEHNWYSIVYQDAPGLDGAR